ncbi:MAG: MFS transporter [Clostridiales bacterium]|nr:MFS transporter [Clostridiales bacterium]
MKKLNNSHVENSTGELRSFLILWLTQSLSSLGSAATNFALIIWSYQQQGSALTTALLTVCSYLPYVLMSIFAGTFCDRFDKKKLMLLSDSFAAVCTVAVLILLETGQLAIWHLYLLNALNGLMNTIQQPASEIAVSLLVPKRHYQRISGLRSFSNSLTSIMTPAVATALMTLADIRAVIMFDLSTFVLAFIALLCFVRIPELTDKSETGESFFNAAREGIEYLKNNRGILDLIFFLAAINLTASMYNAALPALIISKSGDTALGVLNTVTGIAMLVGSAAASLMPEPKSRVRVICNTLLISMGTENILLALGNTLPIWCIGGILGWLGIPIMNANLDVVMRTRIPPSMQGRVYSARNTLQFFTIPIGYFIGGLLVDKVFEPFMESAPSLLTRIFGEGKGSGAAVLFAIIAVVGVVTCIIFRYDRHIWELESKESEKMQ